jgi:Flp pilus assembly protein TadG
MVVLPTPTLIFGIVSFGMTIYTYSFLSNAAQQGALLEVRQIRYPLLGRRVSQSGSP